MIDNKEENNLCFWQAQAFIDYISKLNIRSKGELLEIFRHWADSKDFLEEDAKCIQMLVEEFWHGEKNEVAESECKKQRAKNRIAEAEEDKRQMLFEFACNSPDKTAKEKEAQGIRNPSNSHRAAIRKVV